MGVCLGGVIIVGVLTWYFMRTMLKKDHKFDLEEDHFLCAIRLFYVDFAIVSVLLLAAVLWFILRMIGKLLKLIYNALKSLCAKKPKVEE